MNLNYDMASFVDPKIQIAPRELPVEEMMKVGNVLQDRFDKAMENETKTQAIARKLKASSNPADHAVADQIMNTYNQRLKDRATNGRYQDMQWQTQQDALDAAGMFEGLSNRNKQIEKAKTDILNSKDYQYSKDKRLKEFNASIKSSTFNKDNRILEGLGVDPYSTAADVDKQKLALSYGTVMKPISIGGEYGTLKYKDVNGQETADPTKAFATYHVTQGGKETKLTPQEISAAVGQTMLSDESVQAELNRDLNYEFKYGNFQGVDPNSQQGQQLKQQYIQNNILDKANNAGNLLKIYNKDTKSDITESGSAYAAFNGRRGYEPFDPDLHFNSIVSDIDLAKSVEDVRNNQAKISSTNFDANGNFKVSKGMLDNTALENGSVGFTNYGGQGTGNSIKTIAKMSDLIPEWQIKRIKDQHPGYTDKQVFDDFSNQKADAAKLLLKKYNVSSKEMAGVVDANTKRLLTTLPFKVKDGDTDRDATEDEIQQALKDGQVSYIPASGQTVVNSKGLKLISALGEQGKSIDANPYQVRMSQMKQMLQSALDPSVNFETSIGKFEMPEPVRQPDGSLRNEMTHFRMIKKGDVATDENGKKYYVNSDQIQQVTPEGKIVNRYGLDSEGLNKFVNHNLSNAVMDFTEK